MTGSTRRRPAQLSGSRGFLRRGVARGRGSRQAPRGSGPGSRMGGTGPRPQFRAGAEGLGGERVLPVEAPSLRYLSPGLERGVSCLRSGAVVWGFPAPWGGTRVASLGRGRLASVAPASVRVVFAALLLARFRKSSFCAFVPVST